MTMPNFMSKAFSYQDFGRGLYAPLGMIRQKYPVADRVKVQFKQGRSHQTIKRVREARGTTPPLGLPTGDDIGERKHGRYR